MRIFLIILRVGVLLLALGGVGGGGLITYFTWDGFISKKAVHQANVKELKAAQVLASSSSANPFVKEVARKVEPKGKKEVEKGTQRFRMFPFLIAGIALGLLSSVLALLGRTTSGGVLLLLAAVGPGVIEPFALVFTFPYVLAGMLSLFASFLAWVTRPKGPPAGEDLEEPPRGRASAKRKSSLDEDEEPVDSIRKPKGKGEIDEDEEPLPPRTSPKRKGLLDEEEEPAESPKPDKKRKGRFEDEEDEPAPRPSPKRRRE